MTNAPHGRELVELVERSPHRRRILETIPLVEAELAAGYAAAGRGAPLPGVAPVELSRRLGVALGVIAYHVRTLADAGALELVAERRIRGAVEHRYAITAAGAAARADTALEVAVRALEAIGAGMHDLNPAAHANAALRRLGRPAPTSAPRPTLAEEATVRVIRQMAADGEVTPEEAEVMLGDAR